MGNLGIKILLLITLIFELMEPSTNFIRSGIEKAPAALKIISLLDQSDADQLLANDKLPGADDGARLLLVDVGVCYATLVKDESEFFFEIQRKPIDGFELSRVSSFTNDIFQPPRA